MEKQHNRGQDGVGVATAKCNVREGVEYFDRVRSVDPQPIAKVFKKINKKFSKAINDKESRMHDAEWLQENIPFTGETLMGHLRYGTHGENSINACHPFLRQNNWRSRSLLVAGNFNMTNVGELFDKLVDLGQHPKAKRDTVTVMEKIGHFLDEETQRLFSKFKKEDHTNKEISELIGENIDLQRVLRRSCKDFDGGYAMVGMVGTGSSFVARDPAGIRPAYYYADDEFIVVASEKPAIKTAFNIKYDEIKEVGPGNALIIDKDGDYEELPFIDKLPQKSCSFERIYFSRGSDPDIYSERKNLGKLLIPEILEKIDYDLENTVFSYIPNTAETAFLGMMEGMDAYLSDYQKKRIIGNNLSDEELNNILSFRPRVEKLVIKDAKLRTFITDDTHRVDLVSHVYDTTYEVVRKGIDTIVVIDDSIVRGTTLEKSILRMLDRLEPKKIIIVSSAPQIRFPDCYGIDMSKMKEFVAFRALLELLEDTKQTNKLDEVYEKCQEALEKNEVTKNFVKELYDLFTYDQVSQKCAEIMTPSDLKAEVEVVYQTVENLHAACPKHLGDWYFTGNYPTLGGNRVVNQSFVNFKEGKVGLRAY